MVEGSLLLPESDQAACSGRVAAKATAQKMRPIHGRRAPLAGTRLLAIAALGPQPCAAMLRLNISNDAVKKTAAMAPMASRLGQTTSRPAPR